MRIELDLDSDLQKVIGVRTVIGAELESTPLESLEKENRVLVRALRLLRGTLSSSRHSMVGLLLKPGMSGDIKEEDIVGRNKEVCRLMDQADIALNKSSGFDLSFIRAPGEAQPGRAGKTGTAHE